MTKFPFCHLIHYYFISFSYLFSLRLYYINQLTSHSESKLAFSLGEHGKGECFTLFFAGAMLWIFSYELFLSFHIRNRYMSRLGGRGKKIKKISGFHIIHSLFIECLPSTSYTIHLINTASFQKQWKSIPRHIWVRRQLQ